MANFGFPLIGMQAPAIGMAPRRPSWQERLFDRFVPSQSSDGLASDDKKALVRQGLLQLAMGIQSSPNFGQGITQGLAGGLLSLGEGAQGLRENRLREQMLQKQLAALNQGPSGYREFEMTANAAGLKPGTAEYQRAARVGLGLDPRAVTAAPKPLEIIGADGKKRPAFADPLTQNVSVYDENTGTFRPLQAGESPAAAPALPDMGAGRQLDPRADFPALAGQFGLTPTSILRSPQHNADVGGVPNSFHLTGQAADWVVPPSQKPQFVAQAKQMGYQVIDEGDHVHIEPPGSPRAMPPRRTAAPAGLAVGRAPEEQAALTTAAEENAKLGVLPRKLELEAIGAGMKTGAEAQAKADADRAIQLQQRAIDAKQRADLLNQAEALLPMATSGGAQAKGADAAAFFGISTPGSKATAGLNVIAAQLVQKVPRFEGPQSDKDVQSYRDAAGNLADATKPVATRLAALRTMRALDAKYQNGGNSAPAATKPTATAPRHLKFNPATGKIE